MKRRKLKSKAIPAPYRSKFEYHIGSLLAKEGISFTYETLSLGYTKKVRGRCTKCHSYGTTVSDHTYTPDFIISNGVVVETKGRFTAEDRAKMVSIKEKHPHLDIRMLFMSNNKISKVSKTRYSDWCKKNGYKYAIKTVPKEWLKEFSKA